MIEKWKGGRVQGWNFVEVIQWGGTDIIRRITVGRNRCGGLGIVGEVW